MINEIDVLYIPICMYLYNIGTINVKTVLDLDTIFSSDDAEVDCYSTGSKYILLDCILRLA